MAYEVNFTNGTVAKLVEDGIKDVIKAYNENRLKDDDRFYNIKTMQKLKNLK